MNLLPAEWGALFVPDVPIIETIVRATIIYFVVLALLRLLPNRHMGTIGIADLLVVVLIAASVQNALSNNYRSITDGIILVGVLVFWSHAFNWLGFHVPGVQRLLRPPPMPLIRRGRIIRENMQAELITEDELWSQLRQQGVDDLAHVKQAAMEGDGRISVVTYKMPAGADKATKAAQARQDQEPN